MLPLGGMIKREWRRHSRRPGSESRGRDSGQLQLTASGPAAATGAGSTPEMNAPPCSTLQVSTPAFWHALRPRQRRLFCGAASGCQTQKNRRYPPHQPVGANLCVRPNGVSDVCADVDPEKRAHTQVRPYFCVERWTLDVGRSSVSARLIISSNRSSAGPFSTSRTRVVPGSGASREIRKPGSPSCQVTNGRIC